MNIEIQPTPLSFGRGQQDYENFSSDDEEAGIA